MVIPELKAYFILNGNFMTGVHKFRNIYPLPHNSVPEGWHGAATQVLGANVQNSRSALLGDIKQQ